MAGSKLSSRLYFRQAARVTVVALLLGLLFSLIQILVDFRNERNSMDRTVTQVLAMLRTPATQAAFSLSGYLASGVVDSLLEYQPIYSAAIYSETGSMLAGKSRARQGSRLGWLAELMTAGKGEYTLPLYAENLHLPVGKLVVRIDAASIAGNFLTRAGLTLLFGFLKNIVLALAVSVVFYFTLSRPLLRLSQALADSADAQDPPRELSAADYGDSEMGELLAAANGFMERQVAARTEALRLQNDELKRLSAAVQAAQLEAERASRAKSDFLANMSHELRTPLNAILGYAQILLREQWLDERQGKALDTIARSGEHLLMLVNDVLDLAKIEAGKFVLNPAPTDLPASIQVLGDIIRVKAEEKNLAFRCELPDGLPRMVMVDDKRLRQILLNLLSNAVKFTTRGDVTLRLRLAALLQGRVRLGFEVQDTGVGMTAGELAGLFQRFEQAGDAYRRAEGSGLGLAISRQLVEQMGGQLEVESTPGAGSLFRFELNLPLPDAPLAEPADEGTIVGYTGARRKILVVDDIAANRAMLADLLRGLGFDTEEACNGQEGLQQALQARPDLIVTDVAMPLQDGLQMARQIKQSPELAGVPVILVSASVSEQDPDVCLKSGGAAFLPKPIDQPLLLQHIGRCLQLDWVKAAARPGSLPAVPDGAEWIVPPPPELFTLHELALCGSMREIRAEARRLAALDERYRAFAARLERLACNYQSRAILELVEKSLSGDPA
jgi:signal transduction histidine kinase/ActR/RegA family two-component response regulator